MGRGINAVSVKSSNQFFGLMFCHLQAWKINFRDNWKSWTFVPYQTTQEKCASTIMSYSHFRQFSLWSAVEPCLPLWCTTAYCTMRPQIIRADWWLHISTIAQVRNLKPEKVNLDGRGSNKGTILARGDQGTCQELASNAAKPCSDLSLVQEERVAPKAETATLTCVTTVQIFPLVWSSHFTGGLPVAFVFPSYTIHHVLRAIEG